MPERFQLRVGTEWAEVVLASDPIVVFTRRGYAPAVEVDRNGMPHLLFVSAISIAETLERLRNANGSLVGVKVRLRRQGPEQFSPYEVEEIAE